MRLERHPSSVDLDAHLGAVLAGGVDGGITVLAQRGVQALACLPHGARHDRVALGEGAALELGERQASVHDHACKGVGTAALVAADAVELPIGDSSLSRSQKRPRICSGAQWLVEVALVHKSLSHENRSKCSWRDWLLS